MNEELTKKLEKCTSIEEFRELLKQEQDEDDYDPVDFFEAACRVGDMEFIKENIDEIDLNECDGYCGYLYVTDKEEVKEFLMDNGAFRCQDDYYDYRFSYETVNGCVLSFDDDFREEVLEKYLEKYNLTKEKLISIIESDEEDEDEEMERSVIDDMSSLAIRVEDGELVFDDVYELENGGSIHEILEELDYDVEFEGVSWKLETNGYYFVK